MRVTAPILPDGDFAGIKAWRGQKKGRLLLGIEKQNCCSPLRSNKKARRKCSSGLPLIECPSHKVQVCLALATQVYQKRTGKCFSVYSPSVQPSASSMLMFLPVARDMISAIDSKVTFLVCRLTSCKEQAARLHTVNNRGRPQYSVSMDYYTLLLQTVVAKFSLLLSAVCQASDKFAQY